MPDFHVKGDAGQLRSKAGQMRSHGEAFNRTADGLKAISTDGWKGRAADRFNDKFEAEPGRWRDAGDGWVRAGGALEDYATAIDDAKRRAKWAEDEYARGERETDSAKNAYDADVSSARKEASDAAARGQHMTLTILPFDDPGQAVRDAALKELNDAKADLKAAAQTCAHEVKAGCHGAPEKRNWLEKAGGAVGEFFKGAAEALVDLGKLAAFLANPGVWLLVDMLTDAADGMTAEEIAAKNDLRMEDAGNILQALKDDPVGFGLNMGKAMLDWDTWKDNPSRALGHLVPDLLIAVATGGAGTVATRGAKAVTSTVKALKDFAHGARSLKDLAGLSRKMDGNLSLDSLGSNSWMAKALHDSGLSREQLIERINADPAKLDASQIDALNHGRDAVPRPDASTVMQKVINPRQLDSYLNGPDSAFDVTKVGGSLTRAEDTSHLRSPDELFDGLRLDYDKSPFAHGDSTSHLIRFTSDDAAGVEIPRSSRFSDEEWTRFDKWESPFTGNGFTKATDDVIPEWQTAEGKPLAMNDGAELYQARPDGSQRLVAVLRGDAWERVG